MLRQDHDRPCPERVACLDGRVGQTQRIDVLDQKALRPIVERESEEIGCARDALTSVESHSQMIRGWFELRNKRIPDLYVGVAWTGCGRCARLGKPRVSPSAQPGLRVRAWNVNPLR